MGFKPSTQSVSNLLPKPNKLYEMLQIFFLAQTSDVEGREEILDFTNLRYLLHLFISYGRLFKPTEFLYGPTYRGH